MKFATSKPVEIDISIDEMARLFCEMTSGQQAMFFSKVGKIASTWKDGNIEHQMSVAFESVNDFGFRVMQAIGSATGK